MHSSGWVIPFQREAPKIWFLQLKREVFPASLILCYLLMSNLNVRVNSAVPWKYCTIIGSNQAHCRQQIQWESFLTTHISSNTQAVSALPYLQHCELLNIHGTNVTAFVFSLCLWESGDGERKTNVEFISFQVDVQASMFLLRKHVHPLTSFLREQPSLDTAEQVLLVQWL